MRLADMDMIRVSMTEPMFGAQIGERPLRTHPESVCAGREIPCVVHSPSDHHMRNWPLNWRSDTQVMERTCPHGSGHPDPDHMAYVLSLTPEHDCIEDFLEYYLPKGRYSWDYPQLKCPYPHLEWQGIHGCDGCCRKLRDVQQETEVLPGEARP